MTAFLEESDPTAAIRMQEQDSIPAPHSTIRRSNSMSEHLVSFFKFSRLTRNTLRTSASCNDMSKVEMSSGHIARDMSSDLPKIRTLFSNEDCNEPAIWSGWLLKRSRGPLGSWQSRWFELRKYITAGLNDDKNNFSAVLIYRSDDKGERQLLVDDVRREPHLDSGLRTAFSVCVTEDTAKSSGKGSGDWIQLMSITDLDAVAFLSCLRHTLEPERALPSMQEAIHFPANALRELGEQRSK
jgi:hypothetical protein